MEIDSGDKRVGLFLNSGLNSVTTEVSFDNVSLTPQSQITREHHEE
jgi:hypothetical protein